MKNSENSEKKRTNADRIREMPNEDLAGILYSVCVRSFCGSCPVAPFCDGDFRTTDDWLDWLESEAEKKGNVE